MKAIQIQFDDDNNIICEIGHNSCKISKVEPITTEDNINKARAAIVKEYFKITDDSFDEFRKGICEGLRMAVDIIDDYITQSKERK